MERDLISPEGGYLTDRDFALLLGLFESRIMTTAHIAELYFGGHPEAAKKRLQKLARKGFVVSRRESPFERALVSLTSKSIHLLKGSGALSNYPPPSASELKRRCGVSRFTLLHELAVLDFKVSMTRSLRSSPGTKIVEFGTWPRLYEFESIAKGARVTVKPDGFLALSHQGIDGAPAVLRFFLEVDRSTESLGILVKRITAYQHHYRSGDFARSLGLSGEDFRELPFRVLIILKSMERLIHLARELLQEDYPALTFVLLTTAASAASDPLGAVWIRPIDSRKSIEEVKAHFPQQRISARNQSRGDEQTIWLRTEKVRILG